MDIVEAGWQIVQPILDAWARDTASPLPDLRAGIVGTGGSGFSARARRPPVARRHRPERPGGAGRGRSRARHARWSSRRSRRAGRANVCLTGGRTPRRLYELLADPSRPWRARIDWTRVHVCSGATSATCRRTIPRATSAWRTARSWRTCRFRRTRSTASVASCPMPADAAREYDDDRSARTKPFDVMLLGLGEDAHIASIFPGSPAMRGEPRQVAARTRQGSRPHDRRVAAVWAETDSMRWRITLTPPALLDARAILRAGLGCATKRPRPCAPRSTDLKTCRSGRRSCCARPAAAWNGS